MLGPGTGAPVGGRLGALRPAVLSAGVAAAGAAAAGSAFGAGAGFWPGKFKYLVEMKYIAVLASI